MGCDNTLTSEKFQNFMQQLEIEEEEEQKKQEEEKKKEQPKQNEVKKQNDEEYEEEEKEVEEEEEEEKEIESNNEKITILNNQAQPNQKQANPILRKTQSTSKQIQSIPKQVIQNTSKQVIQNTPKELTQNTPKQVIQNNQKQVLNIPKKIKIVPKQTQLEGNLCISTYSGFVVKGLDFKDCIIKSQEDLDDNLRLFISPIIPKIKKNDTGFNLDDVLYTNSIKINFNKYNILALKDINKIDKVVENNGDYVVFVNEYYKGNKNLDLEKYFAIIVKKIQGEPKILFAEN